MTLRTKLLLLFSLLAMGPLLAVGAIGYALSMRAVGAQIETQTRVLAERSAEEIGKRARLIDSDLGLLAGNAESERLLRGRLASGAAAAGQPAQTEDLSTARNFLASAWDLLGSSYTSIELRDTAGVALLMMGERMSDPADRTLERSVTARAAEGGGVLGSVRARIRPEAVLPAEALVSRFGRSGITAILHAPSDRILHYGGSEAGAVPAMTEAALRELNDLAPGPLRTGRGDSAAVGWIAEVPDLQLLVVAATRREEFAAPFREERQAQLLMVLLLAATVLPIGWLLVGRATRSLEELTAAADSVGRGDFAPDLPPAGSDEVGKLSSAFRTMTLEIRRMLSEVERSRQLAAIGEFAAELSHEIRNPLTAIKLNVQRVERMAEREGSSPEMRKAVGIAFGEIGRLDRVVRGVLSLGRSRPRLARRRVAADRLIGEAADVLREQIAAAGVELRIEPGGGAVEVNREEITGALVNLLLNAVEAMPVGGRLHVGTAAVREEGHDWVEIRITDTGSGVAEAARATLFRPFASTKPQGTGLGLPLALRAAEAHGGTIFLARSTAEGSEFVLRLPAAESVVHA